MISLCLVPSQDIRHQSCDLPCKYAKLPENKTRNRYRDVSPCKLCFYFPDVYRNIVFLNVSLRTTTSAVLFETSASDD